MKKNLIFAISVFWLLSVYLCFITVEVSHAQWASNTSKDLFGDNEGDYIVLQWDDADGAAQYYVYTSTSLTGPWTLSFSLGDNLGGAKVDYTPDARLRDVCYKLEATDANGAAIKVYEPICVPKFVKR
jgi:hypothetical protein